MRAILIYLLILSNSVFSQKIILKHISENSNPILTIDPDSVDYSDLQPIGEAIGNARVVMLGEQDHGDGTTFLAKTRLIRYLHEKKGFNFLAFECDFFGLTHGQFQIPLSERKEFLSKNIYKLWIKSQSAQQLFREVIPQSWGSSNPITVVGFDNQLYMPYSEKHLAEFADSIFRLQIPQITLDSGYSAFLEDIKKISIKTKIENGKPLIDTLLAKRIISGSEEYLKLVTYQPGKDDWAILLLENLLSRGYQDLYYEHYAISINYRDKQMARNLYWLTHVKYPNEKFIIWAANMHIAKYSERIISMGNHYAERVSPDELYILGFTSARGTFGWIGMPEKPIFPVQAKSYESAALKLKCPYLFTDFKKFNALNPQFDEGFKMMGLGHFYVNRLPWNKIFDGMFFIRDMSHSMEVVDM